MSISNLSTGEKVGFWVAAVVATMFWLQMPFAEGRNQAFGFVIAVPATAVVVWLLVRANGGTGAMVRLVPRPVAAEPILVAVPQGQAWQGRAEVAEPQSVAEAQRAREPKRLPVLGRRPYDPAKADLLLDCCANCVSRGVCYSSQGELNAKWDFKCEEYGRDDALSVGRVVDVGKKARSSK